MQRIVAAPRQFAVDADQILHRRYFGREDDFRARQADLFRALGRQQRRLHHGLARHVARVDRMVRPRVLVHQMGEQFLVERAPIGADAHRLVVTDRGFDDGAELPVLLFLEADIAGIDAIFVERLGAGGMIGKELVADIVEVADDRHVDVHLKKPFLDMRHGGGRLVAVDRNAHDLRTGARQRRHLLCGRRGVGGVGIGHRLHHDGRAAADGYIADLHGNGSMPLGRAGKFHHFQILTGQSFER